MARQLEFCGMLGRSPAMQEVFSLIQRLAPHAKVVLITGETGTGKEVVATAIHTLSARKRGPLVKVHCGAIPETLQESELFGHERGAFTGAERMKPGRFELAHKGTLFLDEIGETSAATQVKLLRFLQDRSFERVGGTKTMTVDVRILAATHRDLEAEVERGRFREDLWFRLNVVPVRLPPLRERSEDVPELARFFLEQASTRHRTKPAKLTKEAMAFLARWTWPGNVRELENFMERIAVMHEGADVREEDVAAQLRSARQRPEARVPSPAVSSEGLKGAVSQSESSAIQAALASCGGNRTHAARKLGIGLRTLQIKMKRLGIR
jgi:DNA-binding NtrC family response regulator